MKKSLFLTAVIGVLLTSCNTKTEENTWYDTFATYNHITDLSTGEVTVSPGSYKFFYNYVTLKGNVSTENLTFANTNYSFTTEDTAFTGYYFQGGGQISEFKNLQSNVVVGGMSLPLKNANLGWSTMFYWYYNPDDMIIIPGYARDPAYRCYVTGYYEMGDEYAVATFQSDLFFMGETTTSYNIAGEDKTYTNTDMLYRIVMDIAKNKADMIIYQARFASEMPNPLKAIVIPGLDLTFTPAGYILEGKDIIPSMLESNQLVEMPAFTFNEISVNTTNKDMTKASINYQVAGRYAGSFTGSCVYDINEQK